MQFILLPYTVIKSIEIEDEVCYNKANQQIKPPQQSNFERTITMKHIKTLKGATLKESTLHGGCGECQASCQSACKTSCTVANQKCENVKNNRRFTPKTAK